MASKKVLVVFGATGAQGGSVVKSILGDAKMRENWTVRGVTRDVTKPSAKALESLGAETVAANMNDPATLAAAMKGAFAVYAVTNYWESMSADVEMTQGKALVDAAKKAGVQHYVWSTLMNVTELSKGVLKEVKHFDSKAHIETYVRQTGIPATFFMPGFYMSNLTGSVIRKLPPNNAWTFSLPMPTNSPIPLFAAEEDTGKFVKGILLNREKTLGKAILGTTAYYSPDQLMREFKEVFPVAGEGAKAVDLPHEDYKSGLAKAGLPPTAQEELLQNMRLVGEFGYYGGAGLEESHAILVDKLTTWKEFIKTAKVFQGLN